MHATKNGFYFYFFKFRFFLQTLGGIGVRAKRGAGGTGGEAFTKPDVHMKRE